MNCNATAIRKPSNMLKVAERGTRKTITSATDSARCLISIAICFDTERPVALRINPYC